MSKSNISVGTKVRADKINAKWREITATAVQVGHELLAAKEALPHGDFEKMIRTQLDFSPQTARKLMAVASDQRILNFLNRAHGRVLPDHWTTLYELTKLSDDELGQAFKEGIIRPDMERKDVPKKRKESPQGAAVFDQGNGVPEGSSVLEDPTPYDASEGEDSGVTEHTPERAAVVEPEPKPSEADGMAVEEAGSPSETNAWQSDPADGRRASVPYREKERVNPVEDAGGASGSLATAPIAHPGEAGVAIWVDPTDPMSCLANGLALAMAASRELDPMTAARLWPEDMPLVSDRLSAFCEWIGDFSIEFREHHGAGNDSGLGLP